MSDEPSRSETSFVVDVCWDVAYREGRKTQSMMDFAIVVGAVVAYTVIKWWVL